MKDTRKLAFIASVAPAAQASERRTGVPASVTIAQAALESNWGQSELSRHYHNCFGIKKRQRDWLYCEFLTTEYRNGVARRELAKFAAFETIEDCFQRHGELLSKSSRYRAAMQAAADPLAFAYQLQVCGYATDPNYAKKLVALITQHELRKFDLPRKGGV